MQIARSNYFTCYYYLILFANNVAHIAIDKNTDSLQIFLRNRFKNENWITMVAASAC